MSKTDTFTGLDDAGLVRALAERERELTKLRFQLAASKLQNTSTFGRVRKDIARLQTELRRRELAQGLPKASLAAKHHVDPRSLVGSTGASEAASGGFLAGVVDKLAP